MLAEYLPARVGRPDYRSPRQVPGFSAGCLTVGRVPGWSASFPLEEQTAPHPNPVGRDPMLTMCRILNLAEACEVVANLQLAVCGATRNFPSSFGPGSRGSCVTLAGSLESPLAPVSEAPAGVAPLARTFPRHVGDLVGAAQAGTPLDVLQSSAHLLLAVSACLPELTTLTGQQFGFRFSEASLSPVGANYFFRYASVGMQTMQPGGGGGSGGGGGDKEEVWVVSQAFSWADQGLPWPVQNQGACGDCWAYAVVGSVEVAYTILFNLSAVPLLSVSQLRDALGSSCSQGNSPSQAFQYLVTLNAKKKLGLMEDFPAGAVVRGRGGKKGSSQSPLCGMPVFALLAQVLGISCGRGQAHGSDKPLGGAFRVDGFERTAFHGWFGLLLAVQRQPVVVHVQATAPSFLNHDGLSKYADPECFTYNLNHVVLLVGYHLTGLDSTFPHMAPPFWIIRNSWGPKWGDGGHMRMDIQGGDGVCGINTLPGIYPVVRAAKDPCNVNGTTSGVFGPLFNPCGNFTCTPTPDGASNHCDCNDPRFIEALQQDNSRTCAYSDSSSTYTVVSWGVTCADIHPVYGLTLAQLKQQNPGLTCSAPVVVNTVVNVVQPANLTPCSVYYTTSQGDTCESLASYFSLTIGCPNPSEPCAAAFQALNPGLDCSGSLELVGSQAVCVERRAESAAALLIPVCSQFYLVKAGETCDQIRSVPSPPLSPLEFFRLNPGIKCSRLVPKTDVRSLTGFEHARVTSLSLPPLFHTTVMHL
ncbi:unnamed protein product [Closterium sp. NIES-64]|nr:unnamed protein product [Closterium sp. NIES-64]